MKKPITTILSIIVIGVLVSILVFHAGRISDYYDGNEYLLNIDPNRLDVDSIEIRNDATEQVLALIDRRVAAKIEIDPSKVSKIRVLYTKNGDLIDAGTTNVMSGAYLRIDELKRDQSILKMISVNWLF